MIEFRGMSLRGDQHTEAGIDNRGTSREKKVDTPMKYLWSPWRMKYVLQHPPAASCIFCAALQIEDGLENLILQRGKLAFVIMNRYPYTGGHLMVVPFLHQPSFETLEASINNEIMQLIAYSMQVIRRVYQPDGFNIGANVGTAAGAGVAEHVHFHVVPRWYGDTNFMSSVGETRVLPEDLFDSYRRLKAAWNGPNPDNSEISI